ncbi:COG2426 family protein [Desulfurococcus mucosus]|uniref:Small multi-drug export protein n=1 Tax=Desulfurococcus mucosus (strain ATCC 35584 / DSM 2162 / JCM 9187 / O7/1) TaxID=765177 RepID=E8R852_DESM0|nr:small multi-drug export protein [Desulfurococcus mucosus]ADV64678.1 small multi-drug export protein [Desulfurococcus mucosus DSM 2162]
MDSWTLLWAMILAFAPISEVRGAIPYLLIATSGDAVGAVYGLLLSVAANMAVPFAAFPILDVLDALAAKPWMPSVVKRLYGFLRGLGERKALGVRRGSYIALMVFVAVPLPATGAWTGSLVAYVLGLDRRKSILAIDAGVAAASLIVFAAAYLGIGLLKTLFML